MPAASATWLDLIPGARAGVSYLMGQVASFERLPSRFTQIETAAIAGKRAAEARGNLGQATKLALALQAVASLRTKHQQTAAHLADVLEGMRTVGLGMTPVELGLLAARTATEVAAILTGTKAAEQTVMGAAASVMTSDEVTRLRLAAPDGGGAGLGDYGKYAALLAAGYAVVLLATKKKRRRVRAR